MKIRALVVDDEPRARARMRRLLEPHGDVVVVGEAAHGDEAMKQALALRPDVVFLDIHMPGSSGVTVATRLRDYLPESVRPLIVFTTAHAEHAVEAFGLDTLDYLLKPVERDRLADCLRRVRRAVWATGRTAAPARTPEPAATVTGHRGTSIEAIPVGAITVVQVEDGLAFAYTLEGKRHRLGDGLADVEATLPNPPFVRVSRSALVNLERVDRLASKESGWSLVLVDDQVVGISRRRVKHVRELLGM